MKPPTTAEAIRALLAEVEVYVDEAGTYERRRAETWAKINELGGRVDRAMETMRELIEMVKKAR